MKEAFLEIVQFPVLDDNYNYILHSNETGETAVIDPSNFSATEKQLAQRNWSADLILQTHHHYDHIDGTPQLADKYKCPVFGPINENRIPNVTRTLGDGDSFQFSGVQFEVLSLPGHTLHHCAYWAKSQNALFSGDVLFSLGCGRIFEGTPAQMLHSLNRLGNLPLDTQIFCAHEYTQANGRFALTLEPNNSDLINRMNEVSEIRNKNLPTVPSTIAMEKQTNPFLRTHSKEIRTQLNMTEHSDLEVFTEIRHRKNSF